MTLALTTEDLQILSEVFSVLAERQDEHGLRVYLGEQLSRLLGADYYASYLWSEVTNSFTGRVSLNMSDSNLSMYEAYYQFHDPITHLLRERGEPTLVTQVLPQAELLKTEFFNDFLSLDGLYWGLNLHVCVAGECTGDLRIWRDRRRENFDERELQILRLVAPAFRNALRRSAHASELERSRQELALTEREEQIARLVASGLSDKEIAQSLSISFTTVRTHIKRAFGKLGVDNRVKLASRLREGARETRRAETSLVLDPWRK
jgi:DNA-binding CsgD family transcriptional regulator